MLLPRGQCLVSQLVPLLQEWRIVTITSSASIWKKVCSQERDGGRKGLTWIQSGLVEMHSSSDVLLGSGIRSGRTSQCGGDEVAGGRDLSFWHHLMTALFPQVALLPDWHGGSRYQLALCKYNKV